MKSPKLLAHARDYFGCDTLEGVGLENNGGGGTAGSHWERAHLGSEYMNGMMVQEARISQFTLSLFEDTGWYRANMAYADRLDWGKGDGCGFVKDSCKSSTQYNEFCKVKGSTSCDFDGTFRTYCNDHRYLDGCKYYNKYGSWGLVKEDNKRCFIFKKGEKSKGIITEYECVSDTQVKVKYNGKSAICTDN